MDAVQPVAGAPAATARLEDELALVVADYHAGIEVALRYDGVELDSQEDDRREELLELVERTDADRVIFLGDLGHAIGRPWRTELGELEALVEALRPRVEVLLVPGNHDGVLGEALDLRVAPSDGVRIGEVGFAHGHTWPAPEVVGAPVVCVGHEHPTVRLEDQVGGRRIERVWLRGRLDPAGFEGRTDGPIDGELIVFPAYNRLVGGTWVNAGDRFLSPFLPEGMTDGEAYLLDGTRLGSYACL